jgi:hypothetical protein
MVVIASPLVTFYPPGRGFTSRIPELAGRYADGSRDKTRSAQNPKNHKNKKYFPRYSLKNAISKNCAAQKSDQTRNTPRIDRGTT